MTVPLGGAEEPSARRNIVAMYAPGDVAVGAGVGLGVDGVGVLGVGAVGVVLLVGEFWLLLEPPQPAMRHDNPVRTKMAT